MFFKTHIILIDQGLFGLMAICRILSFRKLRLKHGTRFVYLKMNRLIKHYLVVFFYNPEPIF